MLHCDLIIPFASNISDIHSCIFLDITVFTTNFTNNDIPEDLLNGGTTLALHQHVNNYAQLAYKETKFSSPDEK